jgi:poly-gamma-glutamate capsule biosynthesis protein CapA/YwtB (metallophosphatase superfamily)
MTNPRVVAHLWLLAASAAGGVGFSWTLGPGASIHDVWDSERGDTPTIVLPAADQRMTVLWLGDTFLGDAPQEHLDREGYDWPFQHVRRFMTADVIIANAEAPVTLRTEHAIADQRWTYSMQPAAMAALAGIGIDVIGLANNHVLDRGLGGFEETLAQAADAGILTIGAGATIREAERPLIIRSTLGTVGVVALGEDYGRRRSAAPDTSGILPLNRLWVNRGIQLARKAGADWVVAYVHWGENYRGLNARQRAWAQVFADAGYDLVIGHHPHVVQPVEVIDGMPVVYSLGNFVFGTNGRYTAERPGYGLMVTSEVGRRGPERLRIRCIVTDNRRTAFQPTPCPREEADSVLRSLGPAVRVEGTAGVVDWQGRRRARRASRGG